MPYVLKKASRIGSLDCACECASGGCTCRIQVTLDLRLVLALSLGSGSAHEAQRRRQVEGAPLKLAAGGDRTLPVAHFAVALLDPAQQASARPAGVPR